MKSIQFRLSDDEYLYFKREAKVRGLSIDEYMKMASIMFSKEHKVKGMYADLHPPVPLVNT